MDLDVDLFDASGGAGFDEGWAEGSVDAELGITGGLHVGFCHGLDLGIDIAAEMEANAHLRLLVLGARAQVGAEASAGLRGKVVADPNLFGRFGVDARIEAAAQVAARARLEISLEAEYVAELAAEELDGIALELFLAFLREIRVGGGVAGKVAYSAMARAWASASGRLGDDDDAGFLIGGGYACGLKGGYGMEYFVNIGFDNPRRFFTTAVDLIVTEIVDDVRDRLPPGSDVGIELFRLLVPAGLHAAYDVGQRSITEGITSPDQVVQPFLTAFAEELQRYLIDKLIETSARMVSQLVDQALIEIGGTDLTDAHRTAIEASATQAAASLTDGHLDLDDVGRVAHFVITVAEAVSPEFVALVRRPLAVLWNASAVAAALRDVGTLVASGNVAVLGFGAGARARIREMPPIDAMPTSVREEYLDTDVADFDGTSLSFDHAIDYLVGVSVGPALAEQAPEIGVLLERLHRATGVSPGNIVTFGIQGLIGGPLTTTDMYQELKTFFVTSIDEVVEPLVFAPVAEMTDADPDVQLYMDEVARPTISLMTGFVFDQLDKVVDEPSALGGAKYFSSLQAGVSSLLYKIVARNLVVMEQIISQHVRDAAEGALGALQAEVRSDRTSQLVATTVDHVDEVLASLSAYVAWAPTSTGLTDDQLAAIQKFVAEMLDIAEESFTEDVFTAIRWRRRREAMLALLMSFDAEFDWTAEDKIDAFVSMLEDCDFVPDEKALDELGRVHLDILLDQAQILVRRLPGPLAELMLALTAPALDVLDEGAQQAEQFIRTQVEQLNTLLGALSESIESALRRIEGFIAALDDAIADAVNAIGTVTTATTRAALVDVGQDNLRSAGTAIGLADLELDAIVDGFAVVLEGAMSALTPLLQGAIDAATTTGAIRSALDTTAGAFDAQALLLAGGSAGFHADASTELVDAITRAVQRNVLGSDDGDPDPGWFLSVPSTGGMLTALDPSAISDALVKQMLALVDPLPLVGPLLDEMYHRARHLGLEAQHAVAASDLNTSNGELEAVRARDNSRVDIDSPAPFDPREPHLTVFGPQIPLIVDVRHAGAAWARPDNGTRVQVAVNGRVLILGASEWSYDSRTETLTLDTLLLLGDDHVQPGLNVIEVSVTNAPGEAQRGDVEFVCDPDAPVLDDDIVIDAVASTFDSPGSDHVTAIDEFVAIRNTGTSTLRLDDWRLRDRAGHQYTFDRLSVRPGRLVRVRTGGDPGDDTGSDVHWGRRRAVWNNRGDTVQVVDDRGTIRASYVYPRRSAT